jgi:cytoskeletal protein CcmA (bactofilin family)
MAMEADMNGKEAAKTIIGEDIEITGSIKCASEIRIDGKLNGDLTCSGSALIGTSAQIKGNLNVESVSVLGQINGNITARDRIELKSSARLNGDIRAKRLTVEDGVTFIGKSEVNPAGQAGSRPAAPAETQAPEVEELAPPEAPQDARGKPGGLFGRK